MNWIQHPSYQHTLPRIDRVVVHLEQLSVKHKHSKHFTIELGRLLQQLCSVDICIVKLSQPHMHSATGPMFKLGQNIIQACSLQPSVYASSARKTVAGCAGKQPGVKKPRMVQTAVPSDVEPTAVPSDVEPDSNSDTDTVQVSEDAAEYR